ncbi:unnamed protein product [Vitrella brassicaformis CCMP3155]|uniref:HpcH/HpaI aldolase/citrate lyase domain-containing protein n=2 Tax=Vitrella brassicaformis TaxID=1169539 RepID=A0A0G4GZK1_VITBC|nr:unnamed protein product [Vitrella brassicaformis CCMP3155]|eukprot:CEM36640.1 unnamed protein product [Vitrella brassicaformis CCMP3155]
MRLQSALRDVLSSGGVATHAWLAIPSTLSAEAAATTAGLTAAVVDMQHGMIDFSDALQMVSALSAHPPTPVARIPHQWPAADVSMIHKLLDAGYLGLICPLVDTAEQARAFVDACVYPPKGSRSFGPTRAGMVYGGGEYLRMADELIVKLVMIETQQGLDNLEDILAVEGVDGAFIGPNDLSLALGVPPSGAPTHPKVVAAIERIGRECSKRGKVAGIWCGETGFALDMVKRDFRFVTLGTDVAAISQHLRDSMERFNKLSSSE